jgi:hypothetical protein
MFWISVIEIFGFNNTFLIFSYHISTPSTEVSVILFSHKNKNGWSNHQVSDIFSSDTINPSNRVSIFKSNKSSVFHKRFKYSIRLFVSLISSSILLICFSYLSSFQEISLNLIFHKILCKYSLYIQEISSITFTCNIFVLIFSFCS